MSWWIGRIEPSMWFEGPSWHAVLPADVRVGVLSLGIGRLVPEEIERAHGEILAKVALLEREGVDVINVGGSPVVGAYGRDGHARLLEEIDRIVTRPFVTSLQAELEALRVVGAGKVAIASPYPVAEQHRLLHGVGDEHHRGGPGLPDLEQLLLEQPLVCSSSAPNGSSMSSTFGSTASARVHGISAKLWNTIARSGPGPRTGSPSMMMSPYSHGVSPSIRRSSVVLPQPLGPSTVRNSLSSMVRFESLSASTGLLPLFPGNVLQRPLISIMSCRPIRRDGPPAPTGRPGARASALR